MARRPGALPHGRTWATHAEGKRPATHTVPSMKRPKQGHPQRRDGGQRPQGLGEGGADGLFMGAGVCPRSGENVLELQDGRTAL